MARKSAELSRYEIKVKALLVEREFWVNQSRQLQNQVASWQRMYSDLLNQLGEGVVTSKEVEDNLALAREALRQPLTAVEDVRALFALTKEDTQGSYHLKGRGRDARVTGGRGWTQKLLQTITK